MRFKPLCRDTEYLIIAGQTVVLRRRLKLYRFVHGTLSENERYFTEAFRSSGAVEPYAHTDNTAAVQQAFADAILDGADIDIFTRNKHTLSVRWLHHSREGALRFRRIDA